MSSSLKSAAEGGSAEGRKWGDAEKLLQHINDVGATFHENDGGCLHPDVAELESLEIHGPAAELEKLKEPLAALPVTYFACEVSYNPTHTSLSLVHTA